MRSSALADALPALISVDWGTSSFRAYLADASGAELDAIPEGKGALTLQAGEHEAYIAGRLEAWRARYPGLPVVASGMVGARQGWLEAPYVACPAGAAEIASATVMAPGGVRILPGMSCLDARGAPDVMRGEETQILGAGGDGVFVLPGTHSKWARVERGRIVTFSTYMTGEVFAVLKTHSVLGRMMTEPREGEGFSLGLDAARALEHPGDLLHAAFMARTFGLFGAVASDQLAEYLSGLLIGAEILAGARGATAATVIGAPELAARYVTAGSRLGVTLSPAARNCATLGQIAVLKRLGVL
jgi:2-dehydro-3-deoxygalactonokinase